VITLPAIAELDEFTVWLAAAAPTDPAIVGSWMANAYKLARLLYPAESSGSRISRLADLCGWPNGLRNIEAGSSNVDVVGAPFTRANPLQEMQNVEASEQGFLFMGKDNKLTFLARHSLFDQDARVELATFGNGVGEVPYSDAAVQNDSRLIINRTEFAMQNGGQVAVYQDDASIASYWPRTDSHSDLQLVTQEEVISAGIWEVVLYKDQTVRISQLTLNPLASEQLLYLCMTAEIGQRLRIRDRKPGVGPVDYVVVLLGMQQTIKRGSLEVTWDVSTVYGQNFMCFGDNFDSLPMGW
jgi:hypothetical protein